MFSALAGVKSILNLNSKYTDLKLFALLEVLVFYFIATTRDPTSPVF